MRLRPKPASFGNRTHADWPRQGRASRPATAALLSVLTAMVFLWSTSPAVGQAPARIKPLVAFPEEFIEIKQWLAQHQWQSKRHDPSRFEVGNRQLRLVSQDDSILIGTKHGFPLDPREWPRLRFRLRVTKNPTGTDNTRKSGDDAAFRIYVAFDRGKGLFGPPHTLVYLWTEKVAPETPIQSPYFTKKMRYLSIGQGVTGAAADHPPPRQPAGPGRQDEAGWVTIERNLLQDYRRAFPNDTQAVPALRGILIRSDSNNTNTSAEAWLATLELLAPAR